MSRGRWAVVVVALCLAAMAATPAAAATLQVVAEGSEFPATSNLTLLGMTSDGAELLLSDVFGIYLWRRAGSIAEPLVAGMTGSLSSDGRYLAFTSRAPDLVPDDPNGGLEDVFFRDLATGVTERIAPDGGERGCSWTDVSDDGRLVFFNSWDPDLVPNDTNGTVDTFAYDRQTGAIERVNVGYLGQQHNSGYPWAQQVSADGRYFLFVSSDSSFVDGGTNGQDQALLRDRAAQTTGLVSLNSLGEMANRHVESATISADGQYVAFVTGASNFLPGTSTTRQVYLRDLVAGTTECITLAADGHPGDADSTQAALSYDGRYVTFITNASNLAIDDEGGEDVYVQDRATGTLSRATLTTGGDPLTGFDHYRCLVSADGRFVAMQSLSLLISDLAWHILLWDRDGLHDVPLSYWAFGEIAECFNAGVVAGYPDGAYQPTLEVTRDQMAVYIARAMNGGDPTGPATVAFTDITNPWANAHIAYCVAHGVVQGYDATHYAPSLPVTRDQMAVFIAHSQGWVAIGEDMTQEAPAFVDVPLGHWAGKAIKACVDHGVVKGYDPTHYVPEGIVTRDQMAVFVARAFKLPR